MQISQDKLGRWVVIRRYRWAIASAVFWSNCVLVYVVLVVLAAAKGRSPSVQEIFWLVLSVAFLVQSGIALTGHHRERAAGRTEVN